MTHRTLNEFALQPPLSVDKSNALWREHMKTFFYSVMMVLISVSNASASLLDDYLLAGKTATVAPVTFRGLPVIGNPETVCKFLGYRILLSYKSSASVPAGAPVISIRSTSDGTIIVEEAVLAGRSVLASVDCAS